MWLDAGVLGNAPVVGVKRHNFSVTIKNLRARLQSGATRKTIRLCTYARVGDGVGDGKCAPPLMVIFRASRGMHNAGRTNSKFMPRAREETVVM